MNNYNYGKKSALMAVHLRVKANIISLLMM